MAMQTPFNVSGFTYSVIFDDYGADASCWGHSHEMCLIVHGGKWMRSRNLLATVVGAILLFAATSSATLGQNDPAGSGQDLRPSLSEMVADQSQRGGCDVGGCPSYCCPRWTASADFILFERIGNANQTLVERVPLNRDPFAHTGVEALNSSDFRQGYAGGPRLDLIRHGDCSYDVELSYFQIDGWSSDRSIGPDDPIDWLVMRAPGGFTQTNQVPRLATQAMVWDYATRLYDAELNLRWNRSSRFTVLAGFRWMDLREHLVGTLDPPTLPDESNWTFWNATTTNNLYGFQIGVDGRLFERGRFSIGGLLKAGVFDNNATQTTEVSVVAKQQRWASASTNHCAFVGETGLQCKYQVSKRFLLRAGYEAIWLQGVALAPGQIQDTQTDLQTVSVQATGVNCDFGVFYHGVTAGLEFSF
jgi:hypothetical protein